MNIRIIFFVLFISFTFEAISENKFEMKKDVADKIINEAGNDSISYDRLANFCDTFGHRFSGSTNLEKALVFLQEEMKRIGLENVKAEEVMVPHWVRNDEHLKLISPWEGKLAMLGLGMSVSTPKEGITAEVLVVQNLEELEARKDEAKGRIVLFDTDFVSYGKNVQYRLWGADWAAQYGSVAMLLRSVSPVGNQLPHTGVMIYSDTIPKIPAAAISHEASDMLERISKRGTYPTVNFHMGCETLPDALSHNVMGELRGSEKPEEIIAIGGHIDSWDAGQGAHDDASGSLAALEAVKLLKELNLIPKRTIRAVMWTNEENGSRGGQVYADMHKDESHFLMFEFDSGVFPPNRIGYTGPDSMLTKLQEIEPLLKMINPELTVSKGGGGVDIGPMMKLGIPGMSLGTDSQGKYFWYHHSPFDTVEYIDPKVYNDCIAAIALAIYYYANL